MFLMLLITGAVLEPKTNLKRLEPRFVTASSFLKNGWNSADENYLPPYVADDDPATAWVEGVPGNGEGETLTWLGPSLHRARAFQLFIRNGYQKSAKLLAANGAPSEVRLQPVRRRGGETQPVGKAIDVAMTRDEGWQEFRLPTPPEVDGFTLTLTKVSPGRVYSDTCISDIRVYVDGDDAYDEAVENVARQQTRDFVLERQLAGKRQAGTAWVQLAPVYDPRGDPDPDEAKKAWVKEAEAVRKQGPEPQDVVSSKHIVKVVAKRRMRATARVALAGLGDGSSFPAVVELLHTSAFGVFDSNVPAKKSNFSAKLETEEETFEGFVALPDAAHLKQLCSANSARVRYVGDSRTPDVDEKDEALVLCINFDGERASSVREVSWHGLWEPGPDDRDDVVYLLKWKPGKAGGSLLDGVVAVDSSGTVDSHWAGTLPTP